MPVLLMPQPAWCICYAGGAAGCGTGSVGDEEGDDGRRREDEQRDGELDSPIGLPTSSNGIEGTAW